MWRWNFDGEFLRETLLYSLYLSQWVFQLLKHRRLSCRRTNFKESSSMDVTAVTCRPPLHYQRFRNLNSDCCNGENISRIGFRSNVVDGKLFGSVIRIRTVETHDASFKHLQYQPTQAILTLEVKNLELLFLELFKYFRSHLRISPCYCIAGWQMRLISIFEIDFVPKLLQFWLIETSCELLSLKKDTWQPRSTIISSIRGFRRLFRYIYSQNGWGFLRARERIPVHVKLSIERDGRRVIRKHNINTS